jgi:hypothetical protein
MFGLISFFEGWSVVVLTPAEEGQEGKTKVDWTVLDCWTIRPFT